MKADNPSPDRIVPDLSRRDLFHTVGLATGGAMLLALPKFMGGWTSEAEAAEGSTLIPLGLELDGTLVAYLTSMEGGNAFADIVPEAVGPDMIQRKRPGPVRFEDLVITVPVGGSKLLSNWITDTLAKSSVPRNGAIVYGDLNFIEVKRLEFFNAMLTEVRVPAADATAANRPAALTLRITPQTTRLAGSTGKTLTPIPTKSSLSSNFRLNVQGLEKACSRIAKVDPIVARRPVAGTAVGIAGVLDCSIVRIILPEADAGPFFDWFDASVVKGKIGTERAGALEWLNSTLNTVVASVKLGGLGIVRYAPSPINAGSAAAGLVQVDMYCETIILTIL